MSIARLQSPHFVLLSTRTMTLGATHPTFLMGCRQRNKTCTRADEQNRTPTRAGKKNKTCTGADEQNETCTRADRQNETRTRVDEQNEPHLSLTVAASHHFYLCLTYVASPHLLTYLPFWLVYPFTLAQ